MRQPRWLKVVLWSLGGLACLWLLAAWAFIRYAMYDEPAPIPFDQRAWHDPDRGAQARYAMREDLLAKRR